MPKENTHIYYADTLFESLTTGPCKEIIKSHLKEYYLGAISPDIYFYHRDEVKTKISVALHGCNGEKTNRIILAMLKAPQSPKDFAFAAGYMTHTVLDMTFHPVVYYLSGNYYDEDPAKEASAQYRHRYIETALDMIVAGRLKSNRILSIGLLRDLKFNDYLKEEFKVYPEETAATLNRQLSLNGLMTKKLLYPVLRPFAGGKSNRGLFYGNISRKDRKRPLHNDMEVRGIFTGEKKTVSFAGLFDQAVEKARPRLKAMYKFWSGDISISELEKIIPGESLDTGSTTRNIRSMRYSIASEPAEGSKK